MASQDEIKQAMVNRSLRAIKTELEFLTDSSLISPEQLSSLLSQLPAQTALRAPLSSPAPHQNGTTSPLPPVSTLNNLSLNNGQKNGFTETQSTPYTPPPNLSQQVPPPAYPSAPPPPQSALCYATALYAFAPTDAGDLSLSPNDRVAVTEYMNAEWWKGKSERTGEEGIFPRSYVKVEDKAPTPAKQSNGWPPMPMTIANGSNDQQSQDPQAPNKGANMGKKFGKKLGNAAVFGAGATIGGNIVNSIF